MAAAETALGMGKAFPGVTYNILAIARGNILSDFHNDDAWVAGFVHLFPEGCGGPKEPARQRAISFVKWTKTLLNRRDDSWPKDLHFLFCVAATISRHEALTNVHFKLREIMSESTAEDLSRITKDVIYWPLRQSSS